MERDSIHYEVTITETRGGGKAFLVIRRAGKGGVLYCDSSCSRVGEDEKITVAKIVRLLENFPLRPPEMFPNTYQNNNFHKKNCYMFVILKHLFHEWKFCIEKLTTFACNFYLPVCFTGQMTRLRDRQRPVAHSEKRPAKEIDC